MSIGKWKFVGGFNTVKENYQNFLAWWFWDFNVVNLLLQTYLVEKIMPYLYRNDIFQSWLMFVLVQQVYSVGISRKLYNIILDTHYSRLLIL